MKRVSPLTALALALSFCSSVMAADKMAPLSSSELQSRQGAIVDTRPSAFYNGWPEASGSASGHEAGALNLSASWLSEMNDNALSGWAARHGLNTNRTIALYGSKDQVEAVKQRLNALGYNQVTTLSDALTQPARLQRLAHYEQLVYPQWIADLQAGKNVANKPAGDWKLLEAGWGQPKKYVLSHIPGADYIDTNEVESEPLWNKVSDEKLAQMLSSHGIRHDTTVVLYGRDVYAAARVAQIMLYAGVKDVRLLDGGWRTWSDSGLPVSRGWPDKVTPTPEFGASIPGQPQIMTDMNQAKAMLHRRDASLVSIRSWPEFIGTTSGYSYIKPMGDIAGARWGHAGSDATHMEDFHNPDGTMRSESDITTMWQHWNITKDQQVAFYCGTGWRAAEAFMYARAMGWPKISLYDGGWYEWSSFPNNPTVSGERGPDKI
ncbi:thiosulfate sulfurtransferase YnjE [Salmonella enterica subsp. enterica serovar Choleraesuis]|nr:thiosulfate sulfurtransferase YnjE [Salmonella enterica subsp. enterica serovar Choleraesuis]